HFDLIQVHAPVSVFRLEEHYDVPPELVSRLHYVGYLVDPSPFSRTEARSRLGLASSERVLVASMGGGQGAGPIWAAVLAAAEADGAPDRGLFVTGPYLESDARRELDAEAARRPWLRVTTYSTELTTWMRASDLFIGAAGSNMLGEILATSCN